jgi:hypothetical protein
VLLVALCDLSLVRTYMGRERMARGHGAEKDSAAGNRGSGEAWKRGSGVARKREEIGEAWKRGSREAGKRGSGASERSVGVGW